MTLPALTTAQMAEVDRRMIEEYGILLIQMMENAGRHLAELARRMLAAPRGLPGRQIVVLCGAGNNGGGGMVAARHLHNRGAAVHVVGVEFTPTPTDAVRLTPGGPPPHGGGHGQDIPAHQWRILQAIGLIAKEAPDLAGADLIVDALIGYGLNGNPRGEAAEWIERANAAGKPILSLDAPSGLDTTTGVPGHPCIRAAATLTLALPKTGLLTPAARPFVGNLYLADIGVPPELYRGLGLDVGALFADDTILRVHDE